MTTSAFGIEHEIAKAMNMRALVGDGARLTNSAGQALRPSVRQARMVQRARTTKVLASESDRYSREVKMYTQRMANRSKLVAKNLEPGSFAHSVELAKAAYVNDYRQGARVPANSTKYGRARKAGLLADSQRPVGKLRLVRQVKAFGSVAKRQGHKDASGAAIASSGAVVGTAGLAGGGVPGVKANRIWADYEQAKSKPAKAVAATRAYRGGEFGYRTNAHHTFKAFGLGGEREGDTQASHFKHGVKAGKINSEEKIIGHLKVARKASNVALVGGAGVTAYGLHRMRTRKKSPVAKADRDTARYNGAMVGVGGTAAAASVGGSKLLEHHGRKWSKQAVHDLTGAHDIIPKTGGHVVNPFPHKIKNKRVPDIGPEKSNNTIQNDHEILSGKTNAQIHEAAKLRGSASQSRYFAATYGGAAKIARKVRNPALATAAVGGGGLLLARKKDKS